MAMTADPLLYGPLTARTVHLCIDMQNVFAEDTPWHTPWVRRILPNVVRIAERRPLDTVFTRFIPPSDSARIAGSWRRYYERWHDMKRNRADPRWFELVPELGLFAPPAPVIDKHVYSPFSEERLEPILRQRGADALVITGTETDVCVLATVMGAIDRGFRVVLATDALCSSSDRTHDALMTLYHERFGEQVETAEAETILACWL